MNFAEVEKIAAAILYEGYILYPYRPTAIKNRQRWNFGTLYPRVYAEAQRPEESFRFLAECLVESPAEDATLDLKIQFLQLMHRDNAPSETAPASMHSLYDPSLAWDEAVERTAELRLRLNDLTDNPIAQTLDLQTAELPQEQPQPASSDVKAILTIEAESVSSEIYKLRLELENATPLPSGPAAKREEALPLAFVSAHALIGFTGAQFISLLDPPDIYATAIKACKNTGVFPVLVGEEPNRTIMFCSPIILYDYPKIAPESEGDFYDGTEMDEMLTLRVLTLTDAEKQEMRHGDPRARQILERSESLTAEAMMKSHGVIRGMRGIQGDMP